MSSYSMPNSPLSADLPYKKNIHAHTAHNTHVGRPAHMNTRILRARHVMSRRSAYSMDGIAAGGRWRRWPPQTGRQAPMLKRCREPESHTKSAIVGRQKPAPPLEDLA